MLIFFLLSFCRLMAAQALIQPLSVGTLVLTEPMETAGERGDVGLKLCLYSGLPWNHGFKGSVLKTDILKVYQKQQRDKIHGPVLSMLSFLVITPLPFLYMGHIEQWEDSLYWEFESLLSGLFTQSPNHTLPQRTEQQIKRSQFFQKIGKWTFLGVLAAALGYSVWRLIDRPTRYGPKNPEGILEILTADSLSIQQGDHLYNQLISKANVQDRAICPASSQG